MPILRDVRRHFTSDWTLTAEYRRARVHTPASIEAWCLAEPRSRGGQEFTVLGLSSERLSKLEEIAVVIVRCEG